MLGLLGQGMDIAERVTVTSVMFLPGREGCFVYATAEYANGGSHPMSCVVAKSLKAAVDKLVGKSFERREITTWARGHADRFNLGKFLLDKIGR